VLDRVTGVMWDDGIGKGRFPVDVEWNVRSESVLWIEMSK
jgi:hypothetical protein